MDNLCCHCNESVEEGMPPFELIGGLVAKLCLPCFNKYIMWREATKEHDEMSELSLLMDSYDGMLKGTGIGPGADKSLEIMRRLFERHHVAKKGLMKKAMAWLEGSG